MGRYELLVRGAFSAAHQLRLEDGSLEPLHGHNWRVEAYLEGNRLAKPGYLADFTILKRQLNQITGALHDTFLNDHAAFQSDNPSTELVARYIHDTFSPMLPETVRLSRVRVWETSDCAATYIPENLNCREMN